MELISAQYIIFELWGYKVSLVELIATLSGLASVYFASKANILTWPLGIVNEIAFMILFYQVQLYSDMLLQCYFFVFTVYGWYVWKSVGDAQIVYTTSIFWMRIYIIVIILASLALGYSMQSIHLLIPSLFKYPAAYPYLDAFITMLSVIATLLLAQKRVESWYLWIVADVLSIFIFYFKDMQLVALEYVVFLILAIIGLRKWRNKIYEEGVRVW